MAKTGKRFSQVLEEWAREDLVNNGDLHGIALHDVKERLVWRLSSALFYKDAETAYEIAREIGWRCQDVIEDNPQRAIDEIAAYVRSG